MPYRALLPPKTARGEKIPVIYLLHGLFGSCDNWLELTKIADYAAGRSFAIVMPEGGDGWYTDSTTIVSDRYESYFTNELMPEIEAKYNLGGSREYRGIAGLSMGGYGALKFAFEHPSGFFFAGSTSGAFEAPLRTEGGPGFDWEILGPSVTAAFGESNSAARRTDDVFALAKEASVNAPQVPYIYIDCGLEDGFLAINRRMAKSLKEHRVPHEYHEIEGGHDWDYWDAAVERILDIFEEKLSSRELKTS